MTTRRTLAIVFAIAVPISMSEAGTIIALTEGRSQQNTNGFNNADEVTIDIVFNTPSNFTDADKDIIQLFEMGGDKGTTIVIDGGDLILKSGSSNNNQLNDPSFSSMPAALALMPDSTYSMRYVWDNDDANAANDLATLDLWRLGGSAVQVATDTGSLSNAGLAGTNNGGIGQTTGDVFIVNANPDVTAGWDGYVFDFDNSGVEDIWFRAFNTADGDGTSILDPSTASFAFAPPAAQFFFSDGDGANSNWSSPANWDTGLLPAATDDALIGGDFNTQLTAAGAVANNVIIGHMGGTNDGAGTLTAVGGTLDVSGDLTLASDAATAGTLNLNAGGTVNVAGSVGNGPGTGTINFGGGALNVTSGNIEATNFRVGVGAEGTFTLDNAAATLTADQIRIGNGGEDGTLTFVKGTIDINNTAAEGIYVGYDNGSTGTLTVGTMGGNDADTTLTFDGGRFEVSRVGGATGTFVLNSGTVIGTQNLIVGQGGGTANVFINGGSFSTTVDVNFNNGTGTLLQTGGSFTVGDDLQMANQGGMTSTITIEGGTFTVNDQISDRGGASVINIADAGTLVTTSNTNLREVEQFNMSGNGVLRLGIRNGANGVSTPLNVMTAATFADTPKIEVVEFPLAADAATIDTWTAGPGTWDATGGNWDLGVIPRDANGMPTGTKFDIITSPNPMTGAAALSTDTLGWTVSVAAGDMAVQLERTGALLPGAVTAAIDDAASFVTRTSDLRIAPEAGADAARLDISDGSLTVNGANLIIGGGADGTVNQTGGTVTVNGNLLFGAAVTGQGGTYNLNAGTLTVNGDIMEQAAAVDSAQFMYNGGTLNVTGSITVQRFSIGEIAASDGLSYTIAADKSVHSTGTTVVGSNGTNATLNVDGTLEADGTNFIGEKGTASGTLNLNAGGTATFNNTLRIGVVTGATGTVNVNGGVFKVTNQLTIGDAGGGIVNFNGGTGHELAVVVVGDDNNDTSIGELNIELANDADTITQAGHVRIGLDGKGTVNLVKGTFIHTGGEFRIGDDAQSVGPRRPVLTIGTADGSTSPTLDSTGGNFEVSETGEGTVIMHSGTLIQRSNNIIIGQSGSVDALFDLRGGTVDSSQGGASDLNFNEGVGTLHIGSGGPVPAVFIVGDDLMLTDGATDVGTVNVNPGGTLRFAAGPDPAIQYRNNGTDTVNLQGGTIDMGGGDINVGNSTGTNAFNFTSGRLVNVGNFNGDLTQDGGTLEIGDGIGQMNVNAGSQAGAGDYTQQTGAVLAVDIDGTGNDQLIVAGAVDLSGILEVMVDPLLTLTPGDRFTIIDGSSTIVGQFAQVSAGTLIFDVEYNATGADMEANNVDLVFVADIPEPGSLSLLALGIAALMASLRRRRRRA